MTLFKSQLSGAKVQRHNPAALIPAETLSPVREKARVTEVKPYYYQKLLDSPWLVLVREAHDGLLYPVNSLAASLCAFAGMPYLDRNAIRHLEAEGFKVEPVQKRQRKL